MAGRLWTSLGMAEMLSILREFFKTEMMLSLCQYLSLPLASSTGPARQAAIGIFYMFMGSTNKLTNEFHDNPPTDR